MRENVSTYFDAIELSGECYLSQGNSARAAERFKRLSVLGEKHDDPISVALGTSGAAVALGGPVEIARSLKPSVALRYMKCVFEETPPGDDPATRHVFKRGADHVFQTAAAIGASGTDRSDHELVAAALWCATSAEFALRFVDNDRLLVARVRQDRMDDILQTAARASDTNGPTSVDLPRELVPLTMLKSMKARLEPDEAVVIVSPVGKGYVWAAFSTGTEFIAGAFDFSPELSTLRELLEQQFAADMLDDSALVEALEQDIGTHTKRLTARVQTELRAIIESARAIYYVAGASASQDSFPLEMLGLHDGLVCERAVVARVPSIEWLRGHLAHVRSVAATHPAAGRYLVVAGAEQLEGVQLEAQDLAIRTATERLESLGLHGSTVSIDSELSSLDLSSVSVVHFVGHGLATEAYEGLPSQHGQILDGRALIRLAARPNLALIEACSVGRMRYVKGGLHDGLPGALVSNGVGAAVAFGKPVIETRAQSAIDRIYVGLQQTTAGEAVVHARTSGSERLPAYMQAALLYYGDASPQTGVRPPVVRLSQMGWRADTIRHLVMRRPDTLPTVETSPDGFPSELWSVLLECLRALVYPRAPESTVDDGMIRLLLSANGFPASLDRLTLSAAGHMARMQLPDLSQRRPFAPKLSIREGEVVAVLGDSEFGISARTLEATAYALGEPALQALGGLLGDLWLMELSLASNIFTPGDLSDWGSDMLTDADAITQRGLEDEMRALHPLAGESAFVRDVLAAADRTVTDIAKLTVPSRLKKFMDWRDTARGVLDRLK